MKTITYNPNTHVLVPKGMMYELPGLPMPISKGEFSKDLFDGFQMHQYAMRCLDEAIAAAPQPEPNPNWCAGCSPDNRPGCGDEPVAYTTPQPDRTAELEAALKVARDALIEYSNGVSGAITKIDEVLK